MRTRRVAGLAGSLLLVLAGAVPAAAEEPASVTVTVGLSGYLQGVGGASALLHCEGLPVPLRAGVGAGEPPSATTFQVPPGWCWVTFDDDPGYLGQWREVAISPDAALMAVAGEEIAFSVDVVREWNEQEPEWDTDAWLGVAPFTVDAVLVNRGGGITVGGAIGCPVEGAWPLDAWAVLNVDWTATQYVGRKTAVHGAYVSDIGTLCYRPDEPGAVYRWATLSGANEGATRWVYGTDGKFAAGTIHVEASVGGTVELVTQGFDASLDRYDPACTAEPAEDGRYDRNGDGFCAWRTTLEGRTQADVRAVAEAGPRGGRR